MKLHLGSVLATGLLLAGCGSSGPPVPAAVPPVEYSLAKDTADAVAKDLIQYDMKDLYSRLDVGFHTVISSQSGLEDVVTRMYKTYGHPKECLFKTAKSNVRVDGDWRRTARTFFYAVKTGQVSFGKYFLRVEVVPAYNNSAGVIYVSGFGIFTFKNGNVPEPLR